eukprot:CAMPEP_0179363568 /NCGR_PEP_ID=MMETSP0797-20121207/81595_1 /TAXON_ID=47934 /ORGANISM="Dinophysis acuminata, Strain DAEP01" /LENGTH=303 /DNA_ID=CAMNT_0021079029 /DNA_START=342 /DNA_END=1253 /DNA_ORIENTATION=-
MSTSSVRPPAAVPQDEQDHVVFEVLLRRVRPGDVELGGPREPAHHVVPEAVGPRRGGGPAAAVPAAALQGPAEERLAHLLAPADPPGDAPAGEHRLDPGVAPEGPGAAREHRDRDGRGAREPRDRREHWGGLQAAVARVGGAEDHVNVREPAACGGALEEEGEVQHAAVVELLAEQPPRGEDLVADHLYSAAAPGAASMAPSTICFDTVPGLSLWNHASATASTVWFFASGNTGSATTPSRGRPAQVPLVLERRGAPVPPRPPRPPPAGQGLRTAGEGGQQRDREDVARHALGAEGRAGGGRG